MVTSSLLLYVYDESTLLLATHCHKSLLLCILNRRIAASLVLHEANTTRS